MRISESLVVNRAGCVDGTLVLHTGFKNYTLHLSGTTTRQQLEALSHKLSGRGVHLDTKHGQIRIGETEVVDLEAYGIHSWTVTVQEIDTRQAA